MSAAGSFPLGPGRTATLDAATGWTTNPPDDLLTGFLNDRFGDDPTRAPLGHHHMPLGGFRLVEAARVFGAKADGPAAEPLPEGAVS